MSEFWIGWFSCLVAIILSFPLAMMCEVALFTAGFLYGFLRAIKRINGRAALAKAFVTPSNYLFAVRLFYWRLFSLRQTISRTTSVKFINGDRWELYFKYKVKE